MSEVIDVDEVERELVEADQGGATYMKYPKCGEEMVPWILADGAIPEIAEELFRELHYIQ